MKNLWKGIKNILNINKKEDPRVSQLSHNGKNINNNLDMANSFNEFFTEVNLKVNKQIPNSNILRNRNVYLPPRIPIFCSGLKGRRPFWLFTPPPRLACFCL